MIYEKPQKNNWKEAVRPSGLLTMDKKGRAIPKPYKICENDHKDPPTNKEAPLKSSVGNYNTCTPLYYPTSGYLNPSPAIYQNFTCPLTNTWNRIGT